MKFKIILLSVLFTLALGCNKVNDIATNENDQDVNATLKAGWTEYSGQTTPNFGILPTIDDIQFLPNGNVKIFGYCSDWNEDVSAELLSGPSYYCENVVYNKSELYGKIHVWGSVEITPTNVDGGVWQGNFNTFGRFMNPPLDEVNGYVFLEDPMIFEDIEVRYTGHGGDLQGMVAKAYFTLGLDPATGLPAYFIEDGRYK